MTHPDTFPIHGITLHHRSIGDGPPLLMIPGSISDMRTWQPVLPQLSRHFRCTTISRRYQHPSSHVTGGDSGVQANVDDLAAFIQAREEGPVHALAHSFGGYVAMELALQHPELVRSLVLEEPIFTPALVGDPDNPLHLIGLFLRDRRAGASFMRLGLKGVKPTFAALAKGDTTRAMRSFIDGVTEGRRTPDTLDALSRQQLIDNITALAGEDPFKHAFKGDLRGLKKPVLLLSGARSPYFFRFIVKQLLQRLPHARHQEIPEAAHWAHIDAPEVFAQAVVDHLATQVG